MLPMKDLRIGVHILEPTAPQAVDAIVEAEERGVDAAWMTLGGASPDPLPIFAAAAVRTSRILLGTSIVPTYPRHPLALAQAAKVVGQLAPGRFRLGVGPSHQPIIEGMWGIPFQRPLTHLREYLTILKAALQRGGPVEFAGRLFKVRGDLGPAVDVQVMASGLRRKAFELTGEVADGAISWVCPLHYIEEVALPALDAGAKRAGRPRPAMVMHLGVCVHDDAAEAREAGMRQLGFYPRLPFYRQMFLDAGFPEAADGGMSEAMLESILVRGGESAVAEQLGHIAATGVDEVICSVVPAGIDREASSQRALRLLAELSGSSG
ncbi:MAG: LLM class flavin-dependent oxidoreductase [Chloroflexi bacterium]|nr:LLM class flavin-dependent oxidoreductase [Chloroflexota bacterium]